MLIGFISFLRQVFNAKQRTLEFQAKVFTALMLCKKKFTENDFKIIENISWKIYENDFINAFFLKYAIKEFTIRYKEMNYGLDKLLKEISRELKFNKKCVSNIDFALLRELISKNDEEEASLQERVYEFLLNEVESYKV